MAADNYKHADVTEAIIQAYYKVYNTLGYGFLEKVYENALVVELKQMGWKVQAQQPVNVSYKGEEVGVYFADLLVNDCVIVELKAAEAIGEDHEAQLLNYLRATKIEVGLLLNFGKKPAIKRKVYSTVFKNIDLDQS
ncbi:MAG: GxxExxY protein [Chitinophagales bacterium]